MDRNHRITIRVSSDELAEIDTAASEHLRTRSDWLRIAAITKARGLVEPAVAERLKPPPPPPKKRRRR